MKKFPLVDYQSHRSDFLSGFIKPLLCHLLNEFFLFIRREEEKITNLNPKTLLDFESHMPIVIIDTMGADIPDEPKIKAYMKIKNKGERELPNSVSEEANEYDGVIGIEIRGHLFSYLLVIFLFFRSSR